MLTRRPLLAAPLLLPPLLLPPLLLPNVAHAQKRPARPAKKEAPPAGTPATTPLGPMDTQAKYALVMDYNTGAVMLDKEGSASMPPSSMTKLMTAYIVYSHLKAGRMSLMQELPVSERAWRMQGSKMFVPLNGSVRVEDLIRGVIVQSGNDACIVLAEAVAGSEEGFVELMNIKARELGLANSYFRNSTGWPDPAQRMTCRDIAMLARRLITDFPEYYKYDAEKAYKYGGIEQQNRNPLVQKGIADGLKTGHTDEGGYGLVASASRAGRRVIVVVNGLNSMHQRAEESERLLEWSYREFENVNLFNAGDTIEHARVWLGSAPRVPLVGGQDVWITMPRSWRRTAKITAIFPEPVTAPVTRGDVLGKLVLSGQGVPTTEVPLLAGADVPRLGLPGRAMAVMSRFVTGS